MRSARRFSTAVFRAAVLILPLVLAWSVCAQADLVVQVTAAPEPASAGTNFTYTISISNAGPSTATAVILTNQLSDGQVATTAGPLACPSPGPVAWWKAEGTVEDSAQDHAGSLIGDVTYAPGKVGSAFSLDGSGDYVTFPDAPDFHATSFTVEGWFKPASVAGLVILVSKTFGDSSSINDTFAIFVNSGQLNALVPDGAGGFNFLSAAEPLVAEAWYHVAYAFDAEEHAHFLYLNGQLGAAAAINLELPYDANPIVIGADVEAGVPSYFYAGLVDELSFYDHVLSAADIELIHQADDEGKCGGGTLFLLGDLASETATNVVLTVRPTLCSGPLTNTVLVTSGESDPAPENNTAIAVANVADFTLPTLSCLPDKTVECGTAWAFDVPEALDNCGAATVTILTTTTDSTGLCGQTLIATRTWEASDDAGNKAQCSQTVSVVDTTLPVLLCPADKTVGCGGTWDFDMPTAEDACGEALVSVIMTVTNTVVLCGNSFEATRSWAATDPCGNATQCSQTVLVVDSEPLVVQCPEDREVSSQDPWTFDQPETTTCGATVAVTGTSTNTLPAGGYVAVRTWEVVDLCGNSMPCSQSVTVTGGIPSLTIVLDHVSGMVTICWLATELETVLEFATELSDSATWAPVDEPALPTGDSLCVTTAIGGLARYFRLRAGP